MQTVGIFSAYVNHGECSIPYDDWNEQNFKDWSLNITGYMEKAITCFYLVYSFGMWFGYTWQRNIPKHFIDLLLCDERELAKDAKMVRAFERENISYRTTAKSGF